LNNSRICAKGVSAAKNRDWERGAFPRACTCFLRLPGFFNNPRAALENLHGSSGGG
jgi:hypothetical protein